MAATKVIATNIFSQGLSPAINHTESNFVPILVSTNYPDDTRTKISINVFFILTVGIEDSSKLSTACTWNDANKTLTFNLIADLTGTTPANPKTVWFADYHVPLTAEIPSNVGIKIISSLYQKTPDSNQGVIVEAPTTIRGTTTTVQH